jgi:hypothetical protein
VTVDPKVVQELRSTVDTARSFTFYNIKTSEIPFNSHFTYPVVPRKAVYEGTNEVINPCQDPVPLLRDLIRHFSHENDWVLDLMCGSGSTSIAAALEGRHAVAVDTDRDQLFKGVLSRVNALNKEAALEDFDVDKVM